MHRLNHVTLVNFRSFRGAHSFKFPTEPGLYYLKGVNKINSRLDGNGAGKSTLLECIHWCLYGRTTRGLKALDVITWGEKSCSVKLALTVGPNELLIERSQNPNKLQLNGEIVDQEAINKSLRIGLEAFVHSVMLPQFGASFFDLSAAEKLTLFTQIMELDFWLSKSKDASLLAADLDKNITSAEFSARSGEEQIVAIKADISTLKARSGAFESTQKTVISGLEKEAKQLLTELKHLPVEIQDYQRALKGAANREQKLLTDQDQWRQITYEISGVKASLEKISTVGAQCPLCLQNVDEEHLFKEQLALEASLKGLADTATKLESSSRDLFTVKQNTSDFTRKLHTAEHKLKTAQGGEKSLNERILSEKGRTNPFVQMIAEKEVGLKKAQTKVKGFTKNAQMLRSEHAAANYWVTGFKRLRLFIVETALRQLEIEINNNLASLGLADWAISLDVERENKTGGVTRGFSVFVHAADYKDPVKLEAWSGGETQRLRMAGNLGLANLIMEQAGLDNKIEFYDEPSAHLSQEGLLDLAETLAQRAEEQQKVIFLVDHNNFGFPFKATITVEKNERGSRICEMPQQ